MELRVVKLLCLFLKELRKMLGCDNSTGFMQTKWDGAPSVICGTDPNSGIFLLELNLSLQRHPKFVLLILM